MEQGWKDKKPAPLEYFHGELMEIFHAYRKSKTGDPGDEYVEINGKTLNSIIAQAKVLTYSEYPFHVNRNPI